MQRGGAASGERNCASAGTGRRTSGSEGEEEGDTTWTLSKVNQVTGDPQTRDTERDR